MKFKRLDSAAFSIVNKRSTNKKQRKLHWIILYYLSTEGGNRCAHQSFANICYLFAIKYYNFNFFTVFSKDCFTTDELL